MEFPFWLLGRDKKHSQFPGEVLLYRLVGFEPFTAILVYSPFLNPVNPPILLLDWLVMVMCFPNTGARFP
jgi:hypothetical protein